MTARDPFYLLGTTLAGKYRIDAQAGEGGFAVVYRAFHTTFQRPVAVKCLVIPAHFTPEARATFLDRFREEGRHLYQLSEHPSVVKVLDFDVTVSGVPYLVLEWLEGADLAAALREWRAAGRTLVSEAEALALLRPAMEALAFAHSLRLAHRDVKPQNLFVARTARGPVLKVLDFGIAKVMDEGETATVLATRTSSGFHAYSPSHAAPEQLAPKKFGPSGPWTDVHGLGLLFTELVAGRPAYSGEELAEWTVAALSPTRPTPRALGAAVSDGLEAVLARALALSPKERYADAGALLAAIDARTPGPVLPALSSGAVPPLRDVARTELAPTGSLPAATQWSPPAPLPASPSNPLHEPVVEASSAAPPTPHAAGPKRGSPLDDDLALRKALVVGVGALVLALCLLALAWWYVR